MEPYFGAVFRAVFWSHIWCHILEPYMALYFGGICSAILWNHIWNCTHHCIFELYMALYFGAIYRGNKGYVILGSHHLCRGKGIKRGAMQ